MKNPVELGDSFYVLRGFPVDVKIAKHSSYIINMIFHSDTTKKFEPAEDLITVSCYANTKLAEIALQCKNRFVVAECKEEIKEKNGTTYRNLMIKNITVVPVNIYDSEYTKDKLDETQDFRYLNDEELNELPF